LKKEISSEKLCEVIIEGIQDNKGEEIVLMDLREVDNAVTEFFIICTGSSSTQIDGIAQSVVRKTRKELRERPWHQEGKGINEWVLLDYVSVVVHIFSDEKRKFYELEDLWADAEKRHVTPE
jgi:ribosome-associated protein